MLQKFLGEHLFNVDMIEHPAFTGLDYTNKDDISDKALSWIQAKESDMWITVYKLVAKNYYTEAKLDTATNTLMLELKQQEMLFQVTQSPILPNRKWYGFALHSHFFSSIFT